MKIVITKMSAGGFDQESFTSVKEALEFFIEKCVCASCMVTQSEIKREDFDNPRDYEREKHFALIDDWDKNGDWDALHQLLATPCGCEYDVEVVDEIHG